MPLLTELEIVFGCDSTNMSPLTGLVVGVIFSGHFFAGRKFKVVKRKLAEGATASLVEKHTPVPRAKPVVPPAT